MTLYEIFIEPLVSHSYFARSLLAGSLVAMVCGVVGCFIVLRRMAFLGDALAHTMIAGVVAGFLFMKLVFGADAHASGMILGALLSGMLTVGLIGFVTRVSRIKEDAAIGIMYTGVFAAGGTLASLFSSYINFDLLHFIVGTVVVVTNEDLWMLGGVAALVLAVVIVFYRQLQLTSFDPVMAASIGVPVVAMNYLLTTCTSLVVVSAVSLVGVILVIGLLITPAATAYLLSDRLSSMLWMSAMFGVTSVFGGMYVSEHVNVASGPSIVVFSTAQLLVVLAVAPRYGMLAGWLRRRNMVPQELIEDILGYVQRREAPVHVGNILTSVGYPHGETRRALRQLSKRDLLLLDGDQVRLTSSGRQEATRLVRAHRIWEAYLEHVGTPAEQLHQKAHALEHVNDSHAMSYLDHQLGHPLVDPHGAEIPADADRLIPGSTLRASWLRPGCKAIVLELARPLDVAGLTTGMQLTAGPRKDEGRLWTFQTGEGTEIALEHEDADAVLVRLEETGE